MFNRFYHWIYNGCIGDVIMLKEKSALTSVFLTKDERKEVNKAGGNLKYLIKMGCKAQHGEFQNEKIAKLATKLSEYAQKVEKLELYEGRFKRYCKKHEINYDDIINKPII